LLEKRRARKFMAFLFYTCTLAGVRQPGWMIEMRDTKLPTNKREERKTPTIPD